MKTTFLDFEQPIAELEQRGHTVRAEAASLGDANSILIDVATGVAYGAADPREGGVAEGVLERVP